MFFGCISFDLQHDRCLPRWKTESVNYFGLNLIWKHSGHRIKALYIVIWRLCNRERTPAVPSEQVLGDCGEEEIKSLLECILTFQLKSPAKKNRNKMLHSSLYIESGSPWVQSVTLNYTRMCWFKYWHLPFICVFIKYSATECVSNKMFLRKRTHALQISPGWRKNEAITIIHLPFSPPH